MTQEATTSNTSSLLDQQLYMIEVPGDGGPHYVVCERVLVIDPRGGTYDISWGEIARMFDNKPLRAIPLPGKISDTFRVSPTGVSTGPRGGVSTSIEVNLIKVGKDGS